MARRSYSGGAIQTTITGAIDSSVLAFSIDDETGWPTGASGPFSVVLDRGTSEEEKVECSLRTAGAVTVSDRGFDGTTGTSHSAGATAEVILAAVEVDEVNRHAFDTGQDDHTQYLTTTRHTAIEHDTDSIADGAITQPKLAKPAVGTLELIDSAVDNDKLGADAVTSDKILNGEVSTGDLKDLNVTTAKIAVDAIDSTLIADLAVGTEHLQADAVTTAKILDETITQDDHDTALRHVDVGTPLPAGSTAGETFYDTATDRLWTYNGSAWQLVGGKLPFIDARRSSGATMVSGNWTPVSFEFGTPTVVDADGFIDAGNAQFEVPTGLGGRYVATAGGLWSADTDGSRAMRFNKNSSPEEVQWQSGLSSGAIGEAGTISRTFTLAAGNTLAFEARQASGGDVNLNNLFFNLDYIGSSV